MLRGNLSTRPFYNDRIATLVIAVVGTLVLAATVFNAVRLYALSSERSTVRARAVAEANEAARIRQEVDAIQRGIDRPTLARLTDSTQEANRLIDQRTFSWTGLLALLERTLPADVRLTSVSPTIDQGTFRIAMSIVARDLDDIDILIDALSETGRFYDVAPTEQRLSDDGSYLAVVQASYLATAATPAPAAGTQGAR